MSGSTASDEDGCEGDGRGAVERKHPAREILHDHGVDLRDQAITAFAVGQDRSATAKLGLADCAESPNQNGVNDFMPLQAGGSCAGYVR